MSFKLSQNCHLFRCLICWKLIAPDESISEYKDGFCHNICKDKGRTKIGYNKEYYMKHREQFNQYLREYRHKYPKVRLKQLEYNRAYREKIRQDPERDAKYKERQRGYFLKHQAKIKAILK